MPDLALDVLWNVLIPVVPAVLLISPMVWRNTCPLATANMLGNGLIANRKPAVGLALAFLAVGTVLFYVLVPARRIVFNTNGPFLAVTILAVVVLALVMGMLFDKKAGFCNAICPVLPVERIYGVRPLIGSANDRCPKCTACISACIDLSTARSLKQITRNNGQERHWVTTPFGVFAAAFPGFVFGYFQLSDGGFGNAVSVYMTILMWAAVSLITFGAVGSALKLELESLLVLVAPVAAGLYYWYASPAVAETLRIGTGGGVLRVLFLGIVAFWAYRAFAGRWAVGQ